MRLLVTYPEMSTPKITGHVVIVMRSAAAAGKTLAKFPFSKGTHFSFFKEKNKTIKLNIFIRTDVVMSVVTENAEYVYIHPF